MHLQRTAWCPVQYRSLNATVAQSQNCPFAVDTVMELKNITATKVVASGGVCFCWQCACIVGCGGYIFSLNRSINCKWEIFWLCHCCIQWAYVPAFNPSEPSGHYMYHQFNIQQFCVQPTQCIYAFCMDLRTNSDYFLYNINWLTHH
jgi:hypothetical protein